MIKWIENIRKRRNTKKFIKGFLDNIASSVILKKWEHNSWGNAIYVGQNGFYGHLSNVRSHLGFGRYCDLCNRDIIVMKSPDLNLSEGKKYEIGLFANVRVQRDPPDMFFAQYVRLGFADDYNIETIKELANKRIKKL